MRIAIFDFDGTIYSKETYALLMDHLKHHPLYKKRYRSFMTNMVPLYTLYKMKVLSKSFMRSRSMQIYLDALAGLTIPEIQRFFEEIAERIPPHFNEAVVQRMANHQLNNEIVFIVSGAYTPLLHALTPYLPSDVIIGTDVPAYKGKIQAKRPVAHITGDEKRVQLLRHLAGKKVDWKNSFAYGDSYSDLAVLQLVGNPVAVAPESSLKKWAQTQQVEIIPSPL